MQTRFLGAFVAISLLVGMGAVRAEDAHVPVYKVGIHTKTDHKTETLDLRKEADSNKLVKHLQAGEVEHLELTRKPNPMDLRWDTGLWTIVIFVALLLILSKTAWKPMLEGLQKREQSIRAAVDEAKLARDETRRVQAEFQAKMDQAFAEIPKIMEEARRDGDALKAERLAEADKKIKADSQGALREIATAKDQALHEIWNQAAQLATLMSAKAIGRSLNHDDHERLIDESLKEIRDANPSL